LRALSLLRVLVGPIVVLHLWPFIADARDGHIYRDTFYEPYVSWYPELPRSLYVALLVVGVLAAMAASLGVAVRVTSAVTFGVVGYNLFLSTTHVHNNRAVLFIVLGVLALAPHEDGPAWPLWLLRVELVSVYAGSGLSKALDHDWWSGTVTWGRVVRVQDQVPDWLVGTLTNRTFHTGAAKVIILTELFIAAGLWFPRTRLAAVWVAVAFHVSIQITADVQTFSLLCISALVIWAVPRTGERTATVPARWVRVVQSLDWLGRFHVRAGERVEVIDRGGAVLTGRTAVLRILSRLPLTAWFAIPVSRIT
jgi:hypothetical protein